MNFIYINISLGILSITYSLILILRFGKYFKLQALIVYEVFLLLFLIAYGTLFVSNLLNYLSGKLWLLVSVLLFAGSLFVLFSTWLMLKIYRVQKNLNDRLKKITELNRITGIKNENAINKNVALPKGISIHAVSLCDTEAIKTFFGLKIYETLIINASNLINETCNNFGAQLFHLTDSQWIMIVRIKNHRDHNRFTEELYTRLSAPISIENEFVRKKVHIGQYITQSDGELTDTCIKNALAAMHYGLIHQQFIKNYDNTVINQLACHIFITNASRYALNHDLFTIVFQPIVDHDKNLFATEALLRLKLQSGEMISPVVFIPILENSEIILDVTKMVIKKVSSILNESKFKCLVNINLSARCLESDTFIKFCENIMQDNLDCVGKIVFEITESSIANDDELATANIWKLHRLGYKISIDDFGVGYTSLRKISELPVFQIKVDKFFTSRVSHFKKNQSIIKSITILANEIGAHVVAEGVEDNETYSALKSIGPNYFQGYLFAKPTSFDQATNLSWLSA